MARIREQAHKVSRDADNRELDRVLAVMAGIPREEFVPLAERNRAYSDTPLSIGYDQTISDAYIVAVMTAALRLPRHANVLDIGTGSGYQAAVLAKLADRVSSVEIVEPLAIRAKVTLARLKYGNVDVRAGDGFAGWPEHAPFDAILVAAGAAAVPQPLLDQLKPGGRLVMPIGPSWATEQILVLTKASSGRISRCSLGWSMFVPLTGRGERPAKAAGLFDRSIRPCYAQGVAKPSFVAASDQ